MLTTAHDSIQHGLNLGTRIELDQHTYGPDLLEHRASFVTLKIEGLLRGCIGSLKAQEPLINNIAYNAHSAAFHDPRFDSLEHDELALLKTEISILSATEALQFSSEQELLELIRPGIDGLIIKENNHCGTFLPAVWDQLPNADDFLRHLKNKADLTEDYWSNTLTIERYTVDSFSTQ